MIFSFLIIKLKIIDQRKCGTGEISRVCSRTRNMCRQVCGGLPEGKQELKKLKIQ